MDSSNNVYFSDASAIRKLDPSGNVTTIAGDSSPIGTYSSPSDGTGIAATFNSPSWMAINNNIIYIVDYNTIIRLLDITTNVVTTFSLAEGINAGIYGIGVRNDGYIYIRTGGYRIYKIDLSGNVVTTVENGLQLNGDGGIAFDNNILYTTFNQYSLVHQMDSNSLGFTNDIGVRIQGGAGHLDGSQNTAYFNWPYAVATDASGNVYITEKTNVDIRKISSTDLSVTTLAGVPGVSGFLDGPYDQAQFITPHGIAVSADGSLIYVTDTNNRRIRLIKNAKFLTLMTTPGDTGAQGHTGDTGPPGTASFYTPATPSNWDGTAPSTIGAAIDRMATALAGLLTNAIP